MQWEIPITGEEECLLGVEHEAADGGEKHTGLQAGVEKINSFNVVLNGDWNGLIDCLEIGNSREILCPMNISVNVHHRERPIFEEGENLILQIDIHGLTAHKPS